MTEDLTRRPAQTPGVTVESEGDETVLRRTSTGRAYRLNATALALWELCDGTTSITEMLAAMAELFDAPAHLLERDVMAALGRLANDRLVMYRE